MPKLLAQDPRDFRMAPANTSSLAPQFDDEPSSQPLAEQPRDFHFAVTWATLFAHLDLIESSSPYAPREIRPTLAIVPVSSAPPAVLSNTEQLQHDDTDAAWEMVVPKMIRTAARTFVKAETAETN